MRLRANRPVTLGGVTYKVGDEIPEGVILPTKLERLIQGGYISLDETKPQNSSPVSFTAEHQIKKIYNKEKLEELNMKQLTALARKESCYKKGATKKELIDALTSRTV